MKIKVRGGAELLEEGWRLIGETTFTEETVSFEWDGFNADAILIIWQDMQNNSTVDSSLMLVLNDKDVGLHVVSTSKNTNKHNGYTIIEKISKFLKAMKTNPSVSKTNTMFSSATIPYNLVKFEDEIFNKIKLYNSNYIAQNGTLKIYAREVI